MTDEANSGYSEYKLLDLLDDGFAIYGSGILDVAAAHVARLEHDDLMRTVPMLPGRFPLIRKAYCA